MENFGRVMPECYAEGFVKNQKRTKQLILLTVFDVGARDRT
jgi:hypothetical protein